DLEETGDRPQNLQASAVEGFVELEEGVVEALDLVGPEIVGHVAAERVAGRQFAADVPEFLEVVRVRTLGGLNPERRVAARAAAAGDEILALHLLGQREELFRLALGSMDQLVRDAMVADNGEAILLEALAKPVGKGVGV